MEKVKHIVVLGGAGKMGRGIALVLLQTFGSNEDFTLTLMDVNSAFFSGVEEYLRTHMKKHPYGESALDRVRYVTSLDHSSDVDIVFEAVIEDVEKKAKILKDASLNLGERPYFFSNTSSIPIHILEKQSHLQGRLVGFHFYNPPPVQKLVELIIPKEAPKDLINFSEELIHTLKKNEVHSHDVAGFIGNGHFIREILGAWKLVEKLSKQSSLSSAIVAVNTLYQDWLLRPMGIFQLVDYVGIDVCVAIMEIMRQYIPDQTINSETLEKLLALGVRGGQNPDGSQKLGIFRYMDGKPIEVYAIKDQKYVPYTQKILQLNPIEGYSWKSLVKDKDKKAKLDDYFKKLRSLQSMESTLALELIDQSKKIIQLLVTTGVAQTTQDVEMVLQQGFYHLY